MQRLRQLLALALAVALLAAACQSQTTVGAIDDAATASTAVPTVAPTVVPDVAPPTPQPTTAAEPADVDPEPLTFSGEAPAAFAAPDGWDMPFELDSGVVQGQLPNGMNYLIRNNGRPGSQAQLRMVVQAGSLNEEPGTEGVAHFLEHMMFNGTELFPGNEIVQVLEGFGSGFGPDVNAYTSYEETVYELQVPTRSSATIQLGLDVLHQWATAATIAPDDVVAERGVVREELRRFVEPLSGRVGQQVRDVLLDGSDYRGSDPIGTADVIESMTEVELRAFYERWYRPELITIIAVGDVDVADVERRIAATFVQESPPEPLDVPRFATQPGPLLEPVFDVIIDSEIQGTEVEVLWRLASEPPQTPAAVRASFVASMTMSMLNTRLFERLQGGQSVLLTANAGAGGFLPYAQILSLSGTTEPDLVEAALDELLIEIERARQFGFTVDELEREIAEAQAQVTQQFAIEQHPSGRRHCSRSGRVFTRPPDPWGPRGRTRRGESDTRVDHRRRRPAISVRAPGDRSVCVADGVDERRVSPRFARGASRGVLPHRGKQGRRHRSFGQHHYRTDDAARPSAGG